MLCFGTRPQVIKASVLAEALRRHGEVITVDTGQHYDYELHGVMYRELGIDRPDHFLEVGSSDHSTQTAAILCGAGEVLTRSRPSAAVVIGDTNSTLGCALAAAKLRIPVVHVEAGLRSTDPMMAEELNRRVVDVLSAILCAPSPAAASRLRAEHVSGQIVLTGDIARDVLLRNCTRVPTAGELPWWPFRNHSPFIFSTLHRAELTATPDDLRRVLRGMGNLGLPTLLALHPRTRARLEEYGLFADLAASITIRPPLSYVETLACIQDARAVITDSGGVQREAYWLGTPCVTVRRETEWHETVALGANTVVVPGEAELQLPRILAGLDSAGPKTWDRNAYGDGDAANRICEAIEQILLPRGS